MFSPLARTRIAEITCAALAATRSLLLLEDDVPVDWEVDEETESRRADRFDHPHRELLRGRPSQARRAGQPPSRAQVCLCPVRRRRAAAPTTRATGVPGTLTSLDTPH